MQVIYPALYSIIYNSQTLLKSIVILVSLVTAAYVECF